MTTPTARIGQKARKEPDLVFTSLFHHISDVDNLRACYHSLNGSKSVGIDGQTKTAYGEELEENLQNLSARLKRNGYHPQAKRRTYIPKGNNPKGRPLGISNFEDKIVELAVKRTLEPIYEADFEKCSYGYRPGRSAHQCLDALGRTLQQEWINHVVEADIRSFFDKVNHEWLMKFLEHRIGDPRVLKLILRMLRAGIMEEGLKRASHEGTPQGSILSPLLSNIYLHYVLDSWFERKVKKQSEGKAYFFRYADDFVACFQVEREAEEFMKELKRRLEKFGLKLAEEKTRKLAFGRYAHREAKRKGKKPERFEFLGFEHWQGRTKRGYFKVKRRTAPKKFRQSVSKLADWIRRARSIYKTKELVRRTLRRINGHINYYGITDNDRQVRNFLWVIERVLYKWLNRRGQRRSYNWAGYVQMLKAESWPKRTLRWDLNPYRVT